MFDIYVYMLYTNYIKYNQIDNKLRNPHKINKAASLDVNI